METTVEHRHLKNYCIIDFMQSNINFYGSAKNIVGQYFWHYQIWGNQWDCTIAQAMETGGRYIFALQPKCSFACLLSKLIS